MATSGSTNYSRTRNQIISEALELLNVVGVGQSAAAEDIASASATLNLMVKAWQAQGYHLWRLTEGVMTVVKGTSKYNLPGALGSNTVVKTELGADEALGQTVITVDSTAGMTAGDVVLIEQDDGTLHSSTISSVDDATTITIADATTVATAENRHVYAYTTALPRPVRITHVRLRNSSDMDRELYQYSRTEYFNLANKETEGTPIGYYYDPQLTTGNMYIYPAPNSVKQRIHFTYERTIEDFDNGTDDPDFPQEWLMALTYNLALNLATKFETERLKVRDQIAPLAFRYLQEALAFDSEHSQMMIQPDFRR